MNREARSHVDRAAKYLARGESAYHQAAAEMRAAKDAGATWPEIGATLGRSKSWCEKIVAWNESPAKGASAPTPFAEPDRDHPDLRGTRRLLRDAPMEQVEQIVAQLPPERQKQIAAAAGHGYLGARVAHEEAERQVTPAQEREREEAKERLAKPARQAVGAFSALGIVLHLEQATEEIRELQADASLTPEMARKIGHALDEFVREFEFAQQLLGGE